MIAYYSWLRMRRTNYPVLSPAIFSRWFINPEVSGELWRLLWKRNSSLRVLAHSCWNPWKHGLPGKDVYDSKWIAETTGNEHMSSMKPRDTELMNEDSSKPVPPNKTRIVSNWAPALYVMCADTYQAEINLAFIKDWLPYHQIKTGRLSSTNNSPWTIYQMSSM